ncbi:MAG: hypothetical protein ACOC5D_03395 [Thermoplasmatota archaeon]
MAFNSRNPKRASAVQEKKLVKTAKNIAEDPLRVIPECKGSCFLCKFSRDEKKIKKIMKYKDNEKKLKRYTKRGSDLSKAVASSMLLALTEKAPKLARARTPEGEIVYAKGGKASNERLIGIQHFNDPKIRLITYTPESKKGYFFYSLEDHVVCTGKEDNPPAGFVENTVEKAPYNLDKENGVYTCGHTSERYNNSYLVLEWIGAGKKFKICSDCAKKKENLFISLGRRMISKDNSNSFSISANYRMECKSDCEQCIFDKDISVSDELKEKYFGSISDRKFLNEFRREAFDNLESKSNIFAVGEYCYGKDKKAFISHLKYEEWEKPVLRVIMKRLDGMVLREGTVNELLSKVWKKYGKLAIKSLVPEEDVTQEYCDKVEKDDEKPRDVLREVVDYKKKKEKLKGIPEFKKLPPKAKFAHDVTIKYKTEGTNEAVKFIENKKIQNTRMKSLAYGFLVAFGKESSHKWKYSETEVESGEHLSIFIDDMLDSEGTEYAEKLQRLLKESGSTASVILEDGSKLR